MDWSRGSGGLSSEPRLELRLFLKKVEQRIGDREGMVEEGWWDEKDVAYEGKR